MIESRLSTILGAKRMKQIDLARDADLNYQTINDLYHGKAQGIMFTTLESLCRALEVDVGDLLVYVPVDGGDE